MHPVVSVQNKNFSGNTKELAKVLGARLEASIPGKLAKLVKVFPGIIVRRTPHRSETNGIAERAVRRVKGGTSAVLLQSGLNESWWGRFHGMGILICEIFKISFQMGRHHVRDVLGNHFKKRSFRLVHWLSITLKLRRTSQESINLERKSYLDCSSGYALYAGRIWKGDTLVADIEELETMDAREI